MADGVKRAFEARVSRPPQYGYSQEALLARRQILQAACETLMDPSSRAEYTRGLLEDPGSTLTTRVPWDKVFTLFVSMSLRLMFVVVSGVGLFWCCVWVGSGGIVCAAGGRTGGDGASGWGWVVA